MTATAEARPQTETAREIVVRSATEDEINEFVVTSWNRSYVTCPVGRAMGAIQPRTDGRDRYWKGQADRARAIMTRPRAQTMVAELQSILVGWACFESERPAPRIVHYVYTKGDFRKVGVASRLLSWAEKDEAIACSHLVPPWITLPAGWYVDVYVLDRE